MKYFKNYRSYILLLSGISIGGIIGIFFPGASVITFPIGKLYLNFLSVLVTPLIFFSLITAVFSTEKVDKAKKILIWGISTFLFFF